MDDEEAAIEMLPTKTTTPEIPNVTKTTEAPTDEGDEVTKTTKPTKRSPAIPLNDNSDTEMDDDEDSDDDAMTRFLDGDRPTSAGEPSHNVPRKLVINPWCISTSVLLLSLTITILITIFAPSLFESSIQSMLHYMVDINKHNDGGGGFEFSNLLMIFFTIFNTCVFAMCGNIDYLLMVSCGYLYGNDSHEWLTGAAVYIICNYIGCIATFAIGKTLFKDKLYSLFSKYEKYRYFQRAFTDYSLLLSCALNLNPFLPSGVIVYLLSISQMSWMYFLIGQASRIPNATIMSYAGYHIRRYMENEPIENTNIDNINISGAYKTNDYTYGFTITFCILFTILLLFTTFAIYLQFQRLVLGDALKKAEEENSTSLSDESVTDSKEYMDESDTSDESGDTLDEYGHKYLFQDDYDPQNNNKNVSDTDSNVDIDFKEKDTNDNNGHIEMQSMGKDKNKNKNKKNRRNKSKQRLDGNSKKNKNKKKKKSKVLNNKIWQTIVLATSPTEENSMLFQEGPKFGNKKNGNNYYGKQQGGQPVTIEINGNKGNNNDKNNKNNKNKNDTGGKAKSPRSPSSKKIDFGKFNFLKKNNDGDAGTPKGSNNGD